MQRQIFCFWMGDNPMSPVRTTNLAQLAEVSEVAVTLVTPENLAEYLLLNYPLHPAFEFLSATHKSDYLRCYFMHHHVGGYSDIKQTPQSWLPAFAALEQDPSLLAIGYQEPSPQCIQCQPGDPCLPEYKNNWRFFIGNGAFIYRKQSELTSTWLRQLHNVLDQSLSSLQRHPARHPKDKLGRLHANWCLRKLRVARSKYPIRWEQLMGEIHHPLSYRYHRRIQRSLPAPCTFEYE